MTRYAFSVGALTLIAGLAIPDRAAAQNFCSRTAEFLNDACRNEIDARFFVARAVCVNVSDRGERSLCDRQARAARTRGRRTCRLQWTLRRDVCDLLGQDRFDPVFDPASFETDFSNLPNPNEFFPLAIGNASRFEDEEGRVRIVEVLGETRLVDGVTCVVVNEQLFQEGDLVEDTLGSFAQARDGAVWRCGEEVRGFASFDGDDPQRPELVRIDGSFRAGFDGARPGIVLRSSPVEGDTFFEAFALGSAERVVEILSTDFSSGSDDDFDRFVPSRLASLLCDAGDCVVTRNFSLLDPGLETLRFFAPDIGLFLEVNPETRESMQLTDCNFDPRCDDLPRP
jgi:hypothetical protein